MTIKARDMVRLYKELGERGYESIPELLRVAEREHRRGFPRDKDFGQSWRSIKGRGLERVLNYILSQQLKNMELELVPVSEVGDLLEIDFGFYGKHYADVDLVVFDRGKKRILAILSIKTSLRERATQTAYWRNKMRVNPRTQNIKVFLVTPNSDDILRSNHPPNKQRAVLETDIDATYIVNTSGVSIDEYLYDELPSRIRFVSELATDLLELMRYKS